jgi:hypothetical protein
LAVNFADNDDGNMESSACLARYPSDFHRGVFYRDDKHDQSFQFVWSGSGRNHDHCCSYNGKYHTDAFPLGTVRVR